MNRYLVLGGKQKRSVDAFNTPEWKGYEKGVALELDLDNAKAETAFEYVSPEKNRNSSEDASILFKAGCIADGKIFVCTQTEILLYDLVSYRLLNIISLPIFNDIHHVKMSRRGTLLVVSTGLDALFEVSLAGEVINEWTASDFELWKRFSKEIDYRTILTTKPHSNHANYCFETDNRTWVTRHVNRDAICIETGETMPIEVSGPHDGEVVGDAVYFTTVDSKVIKIMLDDFAQRSVYDLQALNLSGKNMGWCRAVHVISREKFIVGFSRLRPTKYENYTRWLKKKIKKDAYLGNLPTRISVFDLKNKKIDIEIDLEKYGLNCVFSILKIPE